MITGLWDKVGKAIFSLTSNELQLGLESDGVSTYYSANITKADTLIVKRYDRRPRGGGTGRLRSRPPLCGGTQVHGVA